MKTTIEKALTVEPLKQFNKWQNIIDRKKLLKKAMRNTAFWRKQLRHIDRILLTANEKQGWLKIRDRIIDSLFDRIAQVAICREVVAETEKWRYSLSNDESGVSR